MYFGIAVHLADVFSAKKVNAALRQLAATHSFLCATIQAEKDGALFYQPNPKASVPVLMVEDRAAMLTAYRAIGRSGWDTTAEGLLKAFVWPAPDGFWILFAAHHLLGDGRFVLQLAEEFADLYTGGTAPETVEERLIGGLDDLPKGSALSGISRLLVNRANSQWRKEGHTVPYPDYLAFEKRFSAKNPLGTAFATAGADTVQSMRNYCKNHRISVNDLLMARVFSAAQTQKVIMAADLRPLLSCYRRGSAGNFATAVSILYKGNSTDELQSAIQLHHRIAAVRASNRKLLLVLACYLAMEPTLIDAAAITALGGFESKAAGFVGGGMFGFTARNGVSLTNLGCLTNPNVADGFFLPPASPAMKETIGALTVNGKLNLCCSYYEARFSPQEINRQLKAIAGAK